VSASDLGAPTETSTPTGRHHVEHVMGMVVSIDVRDDIHADAIGEVVDWLHHVDATFSTYRPESPVSRFGRGEIGLEDLDDEVRGVLELCEEVHADTGGAFDVFAVDTPTGGRIDPSGLVKGWSIERAVEILEGHGARNLCINAGGDIAVRGEPEPGRSWRVGIRHPTQPDRVAAVVELAGRAAIATSGLYERGPHIIDPATGEPTQRVASVTVTGPDLTTVDAYATAVFVMGVDGLRWLQDHHPDHAGFVITHDSRTFATANFPEAEAADHATLPRMSSDNCN
jgi:thiamine biosynthesis lipoprotein